ncbi:MAG: MarR family transcriptional regulator [Pseudomonadota bacterium]
MVKADNQTGNGDADVFAFFNEVGIIAQLSGAMLHSVLPDGVHPSHFAIINHLTRRGDGREPAKIAAAMQVTKQTMTHSLKVLDGRGFIRTEVSPEDGRAKLVYLTDHGKTFREEAIRQVSAKFAGLFDMQMRQELEALRPRLVDLRKHLDENR